MSNGNEGNIDKLYKKKIKPVKGEHDALYFIGDADSDYVDFYVTDKNGNLVPIVDSNRFQSLPQIGLIECESDVESVGYYYYGYRYEDNSFEIIRVQKGNITNQEKSITPGNFSTNWANRETLTYT